MTPFVLLALALAAPPPLSHPTSPGQSPLPLPGVPKGGPPHSGARAAPDFLDRVRTSPLVARGIVRPAADLTVKDTVLPVHVDAWLKGSGPPETLVDFGGLRPVTTDTHAEIFFLSPKVTDGGAAYRCLQDHNEQWDMLQSASLHVDQAVMDSVAGAPDRHVLPPLLAAGGRLGQQAASRLGLLAATDPLALGEAETAVADDANPPTARAELMTFLPSKLGMATLTKCEAATEPPIVRLAAIDALGRAAASDPTKRPAALPLLQAAAQESDVRLRLAAGRALAGLHDPAALAALDGVLASTDPSLRDEATLALGTLARAGDASASARLLALTADSDAKLAERARGQLASAHPPPPPPSRGFRIAEVVGCLIVVMAGGLGVWWMRRSGR
jgi:hypothetical protein